VNNNLEQRASSLLSNINELQINQQASIRQKEKLEQEIMKLAKEKELAGDELDIVINAITILRDISDESVKSSYEFIENSLNATLAKVFPNNIRIVKFKEYVTKGQYPQLEMELYVEGNIVMSLKEDSGHGIAQITSFLCELCLIVITGARRIMVMDEILSGLSGAARKAMEDVMWAFAGIGFQFIVCEHGFIPKGSQVYYLEMKGGVSNVIDEYIEEDGVVLRRSWARKKEERR